jgi:hypothetical protein
MGKAGGAASAQRVERLCRCGCKRTFFSDRGRLFKNSAVYFSVKCKRRGAEASRNETRALSLKAVLARLLNLEFAALRGGWDLAVVMRNASTGEVAVRGTPFQGAPALKLAMMGAMLNETTRNALARVVGPVSRSGLPENQRDAMRRARNELEALMDLQRPEVLQRVRADLGDDEAEPISANVMSSAVASLRSTLFALQMELTKANRAALTSLRAWKAAQKKVAAVKSNGAVKLRHENNLRSAFLYHASKEAIVSNLDAGIEQVAKLHDTWRLRRGGVSARARAVMGDVTAIAAKWAKWLEPTFVALPSDDVAPSAEAGEGDAKKLGAMNEEEEEEEEEDDDEASSGRNSDSERPAAAARGAARAERAARTPRAMTAAAEKAAAAALAAAAQAARGGAAIARDELDYQDPQCRDCGLPKVSPMDEEQMDLMMCEGCIGLRAAHEETNNPERGPTKQEIRAQEKAEADAESERLYAATEALIRQAAKDKVADAAAAIALASRRAARWVARAAGFSAGQGVRSSPTNTFATVSEPLVFHQ